MIEDARQQINEMLGARIIKHLTSPYSCSALFLPKKTVATNSEIEYSETRTTRQAVSRRVVVISAF